MKKLKIIKIGGKIIDDETVLTNFLEQFSKLKGPKILVHGGGKLATRMAHQIGVEVKMIEGRRVTDKDTLDIITMVYAGSINKNIVAKLQGFHCNTIGFTGADANSIMSEKRPASPIDFGYVGDVKIVNTTILDKLIEAEVIPIFCAITHDGKGQLLNTNADTIASELAKAFSDRYSVELYYCFEKNGVLKNLLDDSSVIETISSSVFQSLIDEGTISEGMLPKLSNCIAAVNHGVSKVCIGKPSMLFKSNVSFTTIIK